MAKPARDSVGVTMILASKEQGTPEIGNSKRATLSIRKKETDQSHNSLSLAIPVRGNGTNQRQITEWQQKHFWHNAGIQSATLKQR